MLKKVCKIIIVIPIYIFFALEGFLGGYGAGKYNDSWNKIKTWIEK